MLYSELNVSPQLHQAVERMGFTEMTEIQEKVIPVMMAGRDVIAKAPTGTGKTCAFGIPVIESLNQELARPQTVVLAPTRELAQQIAGDLEDLAHFMPAVRIACVYGGANMQGQIDRLKKGCQIVVATPGRLMDHVRHRTIDLGAVTTVVLDEADEMLNMGFSESINEIFESLPEDRNTLLFSATMSREIEKIAKSYLRNYKEIVVGSRNEGAENVNHIYYMVNAKDKYLALKRIVDYYPKIFAIIFCRTKRETQEIADKLIHDGYNAESLHGDLSQAQRDLTMQKFRQHLTQLLVATDVAARGLDVDDLTHVINYGLPDDIESYTHRSGRTGRAGKKGTSISIVHSREKSKIRAIEKTIGKDFVEGEIPSAEEICKKQLYKVMDQIVKTDVNEEEIAPFMDDINRYFEFIDKEDVIKKIVSLEFGKFLAYYADAPEIGKPSGRGDKKEKKRTSDERKRTHKAEPGYRRLFINLGKADGFYPGELMQFVNRNMRDGRQEIGAIDLMSKMSYFEVPEKDAVNVMRALDGTMYKGRQVRCNDADRDSKPQRGGRRGDRPGDFDRKPRRGQKEGGERAERRRKKAATEFQESGRKDDWRQFFNKGGNDFKFADDEPDFSEEGWARRKPRK